VNRRSRSSLLATVLCTVLLGAGCASGVQSKSFVKPNLTSGTIGEIQAQAIVVVVTPGSSAAQLTGTLFNTSQTTPDQLTAVTIGGTAAPMAAPVTLAPGQPLNLAASGGPRFIVAPATGIKPGLITQVELTFADAGHLTMDTVAQANTGPYAAYQPTTTGTP
jgi:hypothetical protein